ncbi:hypothetical protein [Roseovarius aestuarii]|uniref:Uncharacterized protein n=1 Tax=Roseovarius aestuarii TaxID=475083 RepID=A0A1X7BTU7_9RHOB|nr:hypothetical protein [Roseovarius aestuarii]SMC13106.1 hypothetical protein ROA7745_02940 [Roseovarius aestuarii]
MSFNDLFSKEAEIKKTAEDAKNEETPLADSKGKEKPKDQQGKS